MLLRFLLNVKMYFRELGQITNHYKCDEFHEVLED